MRDTQTAVAATRLIGIAAIVATVVLAATTVAARAATQAPAFTALVPKFTVQQALESAFGVAQRNKVARALEAAAQSECVAAKTLNAAAFDALTTTLLTNVWVQWDQARQQALDGVAAQAEFDRRGGTELMGRLKRAFDDPAPGMAPLRDVLNRTEQSTAIDAIAQQLQRALAALNYRVPGKLSVNYDGDPALGAILSRQGTERDAWQSRMQIPVVKDWFAYLKAVDAALASALDPAALPQNDATRYAPSVDGPLASHCIMKN